METIKFSPIGKQDLRIGTGKFEVTLADGSVAVLDEVDIGYLMGSAYAEGSLPPPTGSGQLARVTDGERGVWIDGPGAKWFQVGPEVLNVDNFSSFSAAITDIGSAVRTLLIGRSLSVTGAVTVNKNTTLWFVNQGDLNIDGGITVTINGAVVSAPRQIFKGSGTVTIGSGRIDPLRPEWWGATVDGSTDDTGAVQKAVTALGTTPGGVVYVSPKTTVTWSNVTIQANVLVMDYSSAASPVWRTSTTSRSMMQDPSAQTQFIGKLTITSSVSSNALTVALKDADGNDPTVTSPVAIPFRNTTLTTAAYTSVSVTGALSVVVSAGSTLGFNASQTSRIYVVAINNAGTVELAVWHPMGGASNAAGRTLLGLSEAALYSTTAEGGAGAADSAQTLYSTTARTNIAIRVLGYIEIQTGATPGNWANAATVHQVMGPGVPRTGDLIQLQQNYSGTVATGTTVIPDDDTIPQSTEGDQYFTQAITPTSTINVLTVDAELNLSASVGSNSGIALFQDATANALAAAYFNQGAAVPYHVILSWSMQAGTVSSTTFKIRAGLGTAGTATVNGVTGGGRYGGTIMSGLRVREIFT